MQKNLSKELHFLINCCKTDPAKEEIEEVVSYLNSHHSDNINLINLAYHHGILPLVYQTLKNLQNNNLFHNTELLSELKTHYISISQKNILMSSELIKIMKLFEENNIEALAFKGPTLAQSSYGNITLRQFGDLDLLIKKEDCYKMINILLQNHYIPDIELKEDTKEIFLKRANVINLHKEYNGVYIDIHWRLFSNSYAILWEENS